MHRLIIGLILFSIGFPAFANEPEETLNKYLAFLEARNFDGIGAIMDTDSMVSLKATMDSAIKLQSAHGNYGLQNRFFGNKVSPEKVRATPAEFYLAKLASEILAAAESQQFFVDEQKIIGRINEGERITHIVARLTMRQNDQLASNVQVYTLVKEGQEWKLTFPVTISQMVTVIESSAKRRR